MADPSSRSDAAQTAAELALLQRLLDAAGESAGEYPWQPADPAAWSYWQQAEAAGESLDISAAEATQGWQALSHQLDQQWASQVSLPQQLEQKFAGRLSPALSQQISARAIELVASGRPLADQMIACVQELLSGWAEADLRVMARPLAYAMRDGRRDGNQDETLELAIRSVRQAQWADLSPMEQARLGLAAARYALDQLRLSS